MLFITHLIVNERKCNQQLLSTLYMELRRLLSPEKMWPLIEPGKFLLSPVFSFLGGWVGGGAEGAGKTREKTFKHNESPMSENPLLSRRISCSKSLHLKF